jgi:hypothetical protein
MEQNNANINNINNDNYKKNSKNKKWNYNHKSQNIKHFLNHNDLDKVGGNNIFWHLSLQSDDGVLERAKIYLDYGANPNMQNYYGSTPLISIIFNNNKYALDLVKMLMYYYADPFIMGYKGDVNGKNAFMVLEEYYKGSDKNEILKELIKYEKRKYNVDYYKKDYNQKNYNQKDDTQKKENIEMIWGWSNSQV